MFSRARALFWLSRVLSGAALALAAFFLISVHRAEAETIPVPCGVAGAPMLQSAIFDANANADQTRIELAPHCTYAYTHPYSGRYGFWYGPAALPAIASPVTIVGNGATIKRAADATDRFRLFFVGADPAAPATLNYATPGAGTLTLRNLTLRNGYAQGGSSSRGGGGGGFGGAIYNQGKLILDGVTATGNRAVGGDSGQYYADGSAHSGGGGIGADSVGTDGGGFGGGATFPGTSTGDTTNQDPVSGGGGGFRPSENGTGGAGGGPGTGLAGRGGRGPFRGGGDGGNGGGGGGAPPVRGRFARRRFWLRRDGRPP